ncbi:MAG: tetratricopeptide repeat protein [Planctomycetes bacterium]|nr:tetratricopeptide repeat protein [Planctomycetota bacterium]
MGHKGGYAYFMLGRCCSELGFPDKAVDYYKMACDFYEPVDPKPTYYIYALNNLGALLRKQKRYEEAKVVYERAQFVNPDYAPAHYNLGVLCADYLNDKKTAVTHFQKYVELKGERSADVQRRIRKLLEEIKAEEKK